MCCLCAVEALFKGLLEVGENSRELSWLKVEGLNFNLNLSLTLSLILGRS